MNNKQGEDAVVQSKQHYKPWLRECTAAAVDFAVGYPADMSALWLRRPQGLQQFSRLRVLSAADNLLPDIGCLEVLTACPHLQVKAAQARQRTHGICVHNSRLARQETAVLYSAAQACAPVPMTRSCFSAVVCDCVCLPGRQL